MLPQPLHLPFHGPSICPSTDPPSALAWPLHPRSHSPSICPSAAPPSAFPQPLHLPFHDPFICHSTAPVSTLPWHLHARTSQFGLLRKAEIAQQILREPPCSATIARLLHHLPPHEHLLPKMASPSQNSISLAPLACPLPALFPLLILLARAACARCSAPISGDHLLLSSRGSSHHSTDEPSSSQPCQQPPPSDTQCQKKEAPN